MGSAGAERIRERYAIDTVMAQLLRAVDLVMQAPDRPALTDALDASPDIITAVADAEIDALLSRSIGRPSASDRLLMRVIHQPVVYGVFRKLKHG
jgi:hypothetical protein